jgi:hypothetical protein
MRDLQGSADYEFGGERTRHVGRNQREESVTSTQPATDAAVTWIVVSAPSDEIRTRDRAEFSSADAMRDHAARLLEEGALIGCFWEPLDVRIGPKALRKAEQRKLREQAVAVAMDEWRSLGLQPFETP